MSGPGINYAVQFSQRSRAVQRDDEHDVPAGLDLHDRRRRPIRPSRSRSRRPRPGSSSSLLPPCLRRQRRALRRKASWSARGSSRSEARSRRPWPGRAATLVTGGKTFTSVKTGRYNVVVHDESARAGFFVEKAGKKPRGAERRQVRGEEDGQSVPDGRQVDVLLEERPRRRRSSSRPERCVTWAACRSRRSIRRDRARGLPRVHLRGRGRRRAGRDRGHAVRAAAGARGRGCAGGRARRRASRRSRSTVSWAGPAALVELALWIAGYYGTTPARALALVAPELPKRRKEQAPPAERQSLGGEPEPAELLPEQSAALARVVSALDAGSGGAFLLVRRRPAQGRPRFTCRPARRRSSAGSARSSSCPRSRLRRRPSAEYARGSVTVGDPPLRADRRRAARRARADRERGGPDRGRGPFGDLRPGARARADRRRRGARRLVQAGFRPAV